MISSDCYFNIFSYLKNDYKILKFVSKKCIKWLNIIVKYII